MILDIMLRRTKKVDHILCCQGTNPLTSLILQCQPILQEILDFGSQMNINVDVVSVWTNWLTKMRLIFWKIRQWNTGITYCFALGRHFFRNFPRYNIIESGFDCFFSVQNLFGLVCWSSNSNNSYILNVAFPE